MRPTSWVVAIALLLAGCGDDGGATTGTDAGPTPADAGPPPPPWPAEFAPTTELPSMRGLEVARAIIHLHSPISHDACDGEGFAGGMLLDPECLEHWRDALCRLHVDIANLTDHSTHANEIPFEEMLWIDPARGDMPETEGGTIVANRLACPDGHRVVVTAGNENALMPIALHRHPIDSTDPVMLEAAYDANGPEAVAMFRDAGGLVYIPHSESRELDYLRGIGVNGMEIYNVHANVDPNIRMDHLGLDDGGYIADLLLFQDRRSTMEPDLAFLTFFSENHNALDKWDALLAEGIDLGGIAGNDAHENTFSAPMSDGERGDSYRRILRWFGNHLLVRDRTRAGYLEALAARRHYVAFEAFGTPVGFDFHATTAAGAVAEMGETVPPGSTLHAARPDLDAATPVDPPPELAVRILRSTATGGVEVARGTGATLDFTPTEPGAYRAEVRIVPHHTAPYLGRLAERLIQETVWVYSNAIRVE